LLVRREDVTALDLSGSYREFFLVSEAQEQLVVPLAGEGQYFLHGWILRFAYRVLAVHTAHEVFKLGLSLVNDLWKPLFKLKLVFAIEVEFALEIVVIALLSIILVSASNRSEFLCGHCWRRLDRLLNGFFF